LIKETFGLDLTELERGELKEVALEVLAEQERNQANRKIPEELNWHLILEPAPETASRYMVYFYGVEPDVARLHHWNLPLNHWVTDSTQTYELTEIAHPIATPDLQRYLKIMQTKHHQEE